MSSVERASQPASQPACTRMGLNNLQTWTPRHESVKSSVCTCNTQLELPRAINTKTAQTRYCSHHVPWSNVRAHVFTIFTPFGGLLLQPREVVGLNSFTFVANATACSNFKHKLTDMRCQKLHQRRHHTFRVPRRHAQLAGG